MYGLLFGLFGLGVRAVGGIKNSIEDAECRVKYNDGFTYRDRLMNEYLCSNGHRVRRDIIRIVQGDCINCFDPCGAKEGDEVIYDCVTKKVVRNITEYKKPEKEARQRKFHEESCKLEKDWKEKEVLLKEKCDRMYDLHRKILIYDASQKKWVCKPGFEGSAEHKEYEALHDEIYRKDGLNDMTKKAERKYFTYCG